MRGDAAWRARGHAAKARACSSQGSPHGQAAKAKAWPHGQAGKAKARSQGLGMLAWARWHALGTPTRPWQHLGGLLLPSLDNLFGHLQLFPP